MNEIQEDDLKEILNTLNVVELREILSSLNNEVGNISWLDYYSSPCTGTYCVK